MFDLSLSKGGKETHVNGERTVRLALGQTGSDVQVYHVKGNGDLERIPSKVENGQVVFKTNHFSLFAIKTLSKNQNVTTPKPVSYTHLDVYKRQDLYRMKKSRVS